MTPKKIPLLLEKKENMFQAPDRPIRDGIELEKGVALSPQYLEEHQKELEDAMGTFIAYPDIYLDTIATENSPSLFFYQRIFLRAVMRYKEIYVVACLKGDTPILTEHGMIPIKDFDPSERVWSDGEWRTVENLNRREWHGNLCQISADNCFEDTITTTDDHKFLVVPRKNDATRPGLFWRKGLDFFGIPNYGERREFYRKALREVVPRWVEAKNLTNNDWLLSSIDLEVRDVKKLKTPAPPKKATNLIPSEIELNNDFYEWLGIWLAEGGWDEHRVIFTISTEEERLKNRIIDLSEKIFGLTPRVYAQPEHHKQDLSIGSTHLSLFFSQLFQCAPNEMNQWNKWIPQILIHCDPHKQLQLVKGWLDGDGYYRKIGNSSRYKGTTVSNQLCEGVKNILYRNFVNPSITTEVRPKKAKVYNVNFNGVLAFEFENAINNNRPVCIDETMRLGEYYPVKYGNKFYMRNKVREVKILPPDDEDVYCLQMENKAFCVNGVEGHNCRAFSKSFISILAMMLECIFIPGTRRFICAPNKKQGAQIAKEKINEIYDKWPLIRREVVRGDIDPMPGNFGSDYVLINFRNGSSFEVCGALESTRGLRKFGGLIDEVRDHEEQPISEIVLPLLNVSRRLPDNTVNPREPNQQTIFATSAGTKMSFAYDKLISVFENSIILPNQSFAFGCDYRVPMMHGLVDRKYINNLKMDPSFNEESFAREYMSLWSGASDESWFNFSKMEKHRKIKNPEFHANFRAGVNQFYFISVDVARLAGCQTVACVFRVNIRNDRYYATLVNVIVLGKQMELKTFTQQAIDLKKLIRDYKPRECLIDTNGLGVGLADEMIKVHYDEHGEMLPAYGFFNDDSYKKVQPKDAICILYSMKANGPLNSEIHGTTYARINGGMIQFLIKEQDAKIALLATKVGQKMSIEQRVKRLMPHEMTSSLFEEMANLRLKRTGSGTDIVLEQINTRFPKDKYSAFSYGIWRIKQLEDEATKKRRRRTPGVKRQLTFFSGGR